MLVMMIEPATASRFAAGANFCSAATLSHYRGAANLEEHSRASGTTRRQLRTASFDLPWKKSQRSRAGSVPKSTIRASQGQLASGSDSSEQNDKVQYHPFEGIADSASKGSGDARLTAEETCRTIVEVNSRATVMLTNLFNEEIHENIVWSDMPYVTDEYGNVYFQVKNDEDILKTLTSENNYVQAIIGFDADDMISEMELLNNSDIDFEGIDDEDSDGEEDDDDDYDEEIVAVLEDDGDEDSDDDGDDEDWEDGDSSHPMYFAKRLTQIASDDPVDWMKQPPTGLAIQGLLRPAFDEEHTDIRRHMSDNKLRHEDQAGKEKAESKKDDLGAINGQETKPASSEDVSVRAEKDVAAPATGTSFYKLEPIKIQLISADGHQVGSYVHIMQIMSPSTSVEPEDFRNAKPDAIAHSAAKIISRLKDGGEEVTEALISLCWRCKGIQVEEATVTGMDSLGFDLRVCSGTQVQTLRFGFNSRATSEYSAERQLNDLLYPRTIQMPLKQKEPQQNEHQ
ncbi:unnamed protein product [Linum tenue]|uniref:Pentatricopeptide repeat (PPR) superfamily protein n=1 Tax=Linum tenue TaxID=586396 RepID=A0AAV0QMY1_9ROSI|nr:unnamed protein product [Linum tenue]